MATYPCYPFSIQRTHDPAGSYEIPVRVVFRITGDDAADVHPARGMDEIAVAKVHAYVGHLMLRAPEEEQIARLQVFQAADVDWFPVHGLLRGIAG